MLNLSWLNRRLLGWLGRPLSTEHSGETRQRGPQTHVIILDGTMSTLEAGHETHAGRLYRLMCEMGPRVSVYYEAGVQWTSWKTTTDVMLGRGLNRQIRRAYGYLASRYRPGDRVFLFGYSRGAFAVRSLAGVIDLVGLLRAEHATERNIRQAYRHYECNPNGTHAAAFRRLYCYGELPIEMVGVWDTVKALGLRVPMLWRLTENQHAFHSHRLGRSIRHGYQALAMHETRQVFEPILWEYDPSYDGHVEQVWFRGCHGDVGGQLGGFEAARPLANLSLIWMLERAERHQLPLPSDWDMRFPTSVEAPSVGTWRGWGKIFLFRSARQIGRDRSERLHESVSAKARPAGLPALDMPKRGFG